MTCEKLGSESLKSLGFELGSLGAELSSISTCGSSLCRVSGVPQGPEGEAEVKAGGETCEVEAAGDVELRVGLCRWRLWGRRTWHSQEIGLVLAVFIQFLL